MATLNSNKVGLTRKKVKLIKINYINKHNKKHSRGHHYH